MIMPRKGWRAVGSGIALLAFGLVACTAQEERVTQYLNRAQTYLSAQDYPKARIALRSALQLNPRSAAAYGLLGEVQQQEGNLPQSLASFRRAWELAPADLQEGLRLAQSLIVFGRSEEAQQVVDALLHLDPRQADVLTLQAALSIQRGDTASAVAQAQQVLVQDNRHINAALLLANVYAQNGQLTRAKLLLGQALTLNPGNLPVQLALADVMLRASEQNGAEAIYWDVVAREPRNLQHRLRLAEFYKVVGKSGKAEQTLLNSLGAVEDHSGAVLAFVDFLHGTGRTKEAIALLKNESLAEPEQLDLLARMGQLYAFAGQYGEADQIFSSMLAMSDRPDRRERSLLLLGESAFGQNKFDKATYYADQALRENPQFLDAIDLRARSDAATGDWSSAILNFAKILDLQPDNVAVRGRLAQAHGANGEINLATSTLREGMARQPNNIDLRVELADLLGQYGYWDDALREIDTALRQAPDHRDALLSRFALLTKNLRWAEARAVVNHLTTSYPRDPVGYVKAGQLYAMENEYEEATKAFREALRRQPNNEAAFTGLIRTLVIRHCGDEAVALLEEGLSPENETALHRDLLAEVEFLQGDFSAAEANARRAMELDARRAGPYITLGKLSVVRNSLGDAETYFVAGTRKTGSQVMHIVLADFYEQQGRVHQAIASYEEILRRFPWVLSAANNLAMLLAAHGEEPGGSRQLAPLLKILVKTGDPSFLHTAGRIHLQRGEYEQAIPALQAALEGAPDGAIVHFHLGLAQDKLGNQDEARRNLEAALAEDPYFDGADEARGLLRLLAAGS